MRKWILLTAGLVLGLSVRAQQLGVVNISVCNQREKPEYSAEMVSQALLGTPVHILRTGGEYNWPEVQTPDSYTGWVHKDAIRYMDFEEYHTWNAAPKVVVTSLFALIRKKPSEKAETLSDAVAGCRLKYLGKSRRFFIVGFPDGRVGYISCKDAQEGSDNCNNDNN